MSAVGAKFRPGFKLTGSPQPSSAAGASSIALAGTLPPRHFLRVHPRAVVDQGLDVPCCVSCALTSAMETLDASWPQLSVLYHYWHARSLSQGTARPQLETITLEEGQRPLAASGICRSSLHFSDFTFTGAAARPSADADHDAKRHRLAYDVVPFPSSRYRLIPTSDTSFKSELLADRPVILGFRLPRDFEALLRNDRFRWLDPGVSPQRPEAGHAVLVCGYDEAERTFCVQDSRGSRFAQAGKWWMGYRVVNSAFAQVAMTLWA